jgi:hypothetical protein
MPEMYDFTFTKDDINALIQKLAQFADYLTEQEWGLLLAIFAAAANQVEISPDQTQRRFSRVVIKGELDPREKTVEELRDQLRKAYIHSSTEPAVLGFMVTPPPGPPVTPRRRPKPRPKPRPEPEGEGDQPDEP